MKDYQRINLLYFLILDPVLAKHNSQGILGHLENVTYFLNLSYI